MTLEEAYRHCELTTRREAANFYYGIRLLAPARRRAMCAVYAFARRIDDIGDGDLPDAEKLRRLQEQDRLLAGLSEGGDAGGSSRDDASGSEGTDASGSGGTDASGSGGTDASGSGGTDASGMGGTRASGLGSADPVLIALGDAYARFDLPPDALRALIAGVRMDVEDVHYETFEELVVYCRCVAGAIGRACLSIFALRECAHVDRARADRLADDLGVALQITNILRDIREDADRGRVYLPAEDLRRYQVSAIASPRGWGRCESGRRGRGRRGSGGRDAHGHELDRIDELELGQMEALVRFEAARAREWFDCGIALAPLLDRRSRACLLAMVGIYSRLLERIAADPARALRERVSLPAHEKAWVAVRSMLGGRL